MNRRITLYGIMAAATTAVASGLVYSNAKSRLAAGLEAMQGNPQEISILMATTQVSFLIVIGASALTAVLFLQYYLLSSSSWSDRSASERSAANRRPAGQSDGTDNLSAIPAVDRAFPSAEVETNGSVRKS